jgi:hypothetical protein
VLIVLWHRRPHSLPDRIPTEDTMAIVDKPSQEQADAEEVMRLVAEGKRVTDPDLIRRVQERAEKVRREIFEQHGVVEWAVDLIREARDER